MRSNQTLRFVKSLPKRERQPLVNKFKNADPQGTCSIRATVGVFVLILTWYSG